MNDEINELTAGGKSKYVDTFNVGHKSATGDDIIHSQIWLALGLA